MKLEFARQIFENKILNFMKIRPVGAELSHADSHVKTNSHFLQFCECAWNKARDLFHGSVPIFLSGYMLSHPSSHHCHHHTNLISHVSLNKSPNAILQNMVWLVASQLNVLDMWIFEVSWHISHHYYISLKVLIMFLKLLFKLLMWCLLLNILYLSVGCCA